VIKDRAGGCGQTELGAPSPDRRTSFRKGSGVGGLLVAIFAAPGAIVVLLGLELLEHRLLESGPAAKGGGPIPAGSATATAVAPPPP
jgi:hypothetical protein